MVECCHEYLWDVGRDSCATEEGYDAYKAGGGRRWYETCPDDLAALAPKEGAAAAAATEAPA